MVMLGPQVTGLVDCKQNSQTNSSVLHFFYLWGIYSNNMQPSIITLHPVTHSLTLPCMLSLPFYVSHNNFIFVCSIHPNQIGVHAHSLMMMRDASNGSKLHSFECWNHQTQIIVLSTSQHSSQWSDWTQEVITRKHQPMEVGPRAEHGAHTKSRAYHHKMSGELHSTEPTLKVGLITTRCQVNYTARSPH